MKFSLLIASAAAIRISSTEAENMDCGDIADKIYEHCDKNGDHGISWKEARGCGAPKKWKPAFLHVAGADGIVDRKEFVDACEAHGGLSQLESAEGMDCGDIADKIYEHCDKNGDHGISWKEARGCGAPKKWKPAFLHVAGKDGIVDRKEFVDACEAHGGLAEVEAEEDMDCGDIADKIYEHCDKNGDHGISWKEARGCGAPKKWKPAFLHVAGKDGIVDRKEFVDACEAHGGLAEVEIDEDMDCGDIADKIYEHCDKNGDHGISWKEARGCGAPKSWKPAFLHVAGADKIVDRAEFVDACRAHGGQ